MLLSDVYSQLQDDTFVVYPIPSLRDRVNDVPVAKPVLLPTSSPSVERKGAYKRKDQSLSTRKEHDEEIKKGDDSSDLEHEIHGYVRIL